MAAGAIVTFYSYKGGVGRTLAVANVAHGLAQTGRSVLMVDFDLEAPGLSRMCTGLEEESLATRPGLVELLTNAAERIRKGAKTSFEDLDEHCHEVLLPPYDKTGLEDPSKLKLLSAGCLDASYSDRLKRLDLASHFAPQEVSEDEQLRAGDFFLLLRHQMQGSFDYVLIDSRTGHSDEMGISTQVLADQIVLVVGMNEQNIAGAVEQANYWRETAPIHELGRLIVLMSPTPLGYEDQLRERGATLLKGLGEAWTGAPRDGDDDSVEALGRRWSDSVELLSVPYHPRLALGEWTFASVDPQSEIALRYRDLRLAITRRFEGSPDEQLTSLIAAAEQGRHADALETARQLIGTYPEYAVPLIERLAFVLTEREQGAGMQPMLEWLRPHLEDNAELNRRIGDAFAHAGSWKEARPYYDEVRRIMATGSSDWCRASAEMLRSYLRTGGAEAVPFAREVYADLSEGPIESLSAPGAAQERYEMRRALLLCGRVAIEGAAYEDARRFVEVLHREHTSGDRKIRSTPLRDFSNRLPYALSALRGESTGIGRVEDVLADELGPRWLDLLTDQRAPAGGFVNGSDFEVGQGEFAASAMRVVGDSYQFVGRRQTACRWYARSFRLSDEESTTMGIQRSAARLGYLLYSDQAVDSAAAVARALVWMAEQSEDRHGLARAHCLVAQVQMRAGDLDRADTSLVEARAQFRESTRNADGLLVQRLTFELAHLRAQQITATDANRLVADEREAARPFRTGQAVMSIVRHRLEDNKISGDVRLKEDPKGPGGEDPATWSRIAMASFEEAGADVQVAQAEVALQVARVLSGSEQAYALDAVIEPLARLRGVEEWLDAVALVGWAVGRNAAIQRWTSKMVPPALVESFAEAHTTIRDLGVRAERQAPDHVGAARYLDIMIGVAMGAIASGALVEDDQVRWTQQAIDDLSERTGLTSRRREVLRRLASRRPG